MTGGHGSCGGTILDGSSLVHLNIGKAGSWLGRGLKNQIYLGA